MDDYSVDKIRKFIKDDADGYIDQHWDELAGEFKGMLLWALAEIERLQAELDEEYGPAHLVIDKELFWCPNAEETGFNLSRYRAIQALREETGWTIDKCSDAVKARIPEWIRRHPRPQTLNNVSPEEIGKSMADNAGDELRWSIKKFLDETEGDELKQSIIDDPDTYGVPDDFSKSED